jgi:hypothetical protein
MSYHDAMKNRARRVAQSYWKGKRALLVEERAVRKLSDPTFGTPYLLRGF